MPFKGFVLIQNVYLQSEEYNAGFEMESYYSHANIRE